MAGKPKRMSQIKQLIQLHEQGKGIKFIARTLGISKNTVKSYLKKVATSSLDIPSLLSLEDPILEGKFLVGNPAYKDERYEHFISKLDYFASELRRRGVTKTLLWEEYRQDYPAGYGHSQFAYHLSQQLVARRPTMVLQHEAGDQLFIDFAGDSLFYTDPISMEVVKCQVFVACLPYSDFSFAMAVKSQCVEDFLYALGCCLKAMGGVPRALVPDNLKSAIIRASPYEPDVNHAMDDFANHYGTTVVPARARKPRDKALVENQVKVIYTRVYAKLRNQQFFSLSTLNNAIAEKIRDHNQTRMQQKPYCREERFLADERHLLGPLPEQVFTIKYYRTLKVAKNYHLYLAQDKHYYSVPYTFAGAEVQVIYTRSMVHVYCKGEQIAIHPRDYDMVNNTTTLDEHRSPAHKHHHARSAQYYLQKAKETEGPFYELLQGVFTQKRHPEQHYHTCDGLFSLRRKTEPDTFNDACRVALEHENYAYTFLLNIIKNGMAKPSDIKPSKPLPTHQNIRGKAYYKQSNKTENYDAN